ncbi:hypothetical protein GN956_G3876 [Arapaima gigas]
MILSFVIELSSDNLAGSKRNTRNKECAGIINSPLSQEEVPHSYQGHLILFDDPLLTMQHPNFSTSCQCWASRAVQHGEPSCVLPFRQNGLGVWCEAYSFRTADPRTMGLSGLQSRRRETSRKKQQVNPNWQNELKAEPPLLQAYRVGIFKSTAGEAIITQNTQ